MPTDDTATGSVGSGHESGWPSLIGARDRATTLSRLTQHQRPLAPFLSGGRISFVTADPDVFASVLEHRAAIYTRPQHDYRHLLCLCTREGRFALGARGEKEGSANLALMQLSLRATTAEVAQGLVDRCGEGRTVSLLSSMRQLALRSMSRLLFGVDSAPWAEDFVDASAFLEEWQVSVAGASEHPAIPHFLRASEIRHRAAAAILTQRQAVLSALGDASNPRTNVIETLMNAYNGLALTLSRIVCELARNPELYQSVVTVSDTMAANVRSSGSQQAGTLIRQLAMECLRMYPAAWTIARRAVQPDMLGNQYVPAGATIQCCVFALHRNRMFWDTPEVCNPHRPAWRGTRVNARKAFAAFGAGEQACPAGPLVPTMLETIVATLCEYCDASLVTENIGSRTLVSLMPYPDPRVVFTKKRKRRP